jgi:L-ascorbate metabolism protein UlaG (beta-lactamase superfamily)
MTIYTFLGHGVHQIETGGYNLLIDPFLTNNPQAAITADEANPDFIYVSHGHGDHIGDTVAIAKRTGALVISNADICGRLSEQGLKVHGQHIGGGYHHPFGYLKMTIAFHGSGMPDGSYGGNPAGLHLTTKDSKKIYIACDTGLFSDMSLYGEGGLDLAVLPIGDNYTMGPDDALKAVKYLKPRIAVPCHYNTWPPIEQDAEAWATRVRTETDTKVRVLKPGESINLG